MSTINVSPEEIQKFSAFASDWWDPQGKMKPLHLMNAPRLNYIKKHTVLSGQNVLDVGCGGGLLSEAMATEGAQVTALDLNADLIAVAKQHAEQNHFNIDYRCQSIEALAEEKKHSFDVLTCMELLEHVPDPKSMIENCMQLVKPNGKVFFSTINRNPKSYLLAIVGAEYLLHWLPPGTHHYAEFIRPAELTRWANAAQLKLIDLTGMKYQFLQKQFELCSDISVNYLAHFTYDS